ncbi:uncharacterized protein LOC134207328 [Armigeres subalbatus]|uniref:uncharacterized protein LOC134207328 n=1 Tax=Armigeres subalbatus TaxID=124917 RepID=UPI002ED6028A
MLEKPALEVDSVRQKKLENDAQSETLFPCNRCGREHRRKMCPAFNRKCLKCGKKGHFAEKCFGSGASSFIRREGNTRYVKTLEVDDEEELSVEELYIAAIDDDDEHSDEVWYETVKINGKSITLKLDSGAACNVLPWDIFRTLGESLKQSKTKRLISYTNHKVNVKGEVELPVMVRGRRESATFKIVDGDVIPILGRKTSVRFNLIARLDEVNMESSLFSGLGCVKGFIYDIDLVENPAFQNDPPRRIPHALRATVKEELDLMLKMGVIEPIAEPTPVLNAMVIVRQKASDVVLKPRIVNCVPENLKDERLQQKKYADRGAVKPPEYDEKQAVMLQDTKTKLWERGRITKELEQPRSYMVQLRNGNIIRRNVRDIKQRTVSAYEEPVGKSLSSQPSLADNIYQDHQVTDEEVSRSHQQPEQSFTQPISPTRTRSGRVVRANRDTDFDYY